jgi:hypothetical protein
MCAFSDRHLRLLVVLVRLVLLQMGLVVLLLTQLMQGHLLLVGRVPVCLVSLLL